MPKDENDREYFYLHEARPWMKYYPEGILERKYPETNLFRYLLSKNVDRMNSVSQIYYGKKFTFDDLRKESILSAQILNELGTKKGDNITNLVPNIPEASRLWFGATEIGAISDFIDPRPDTMDIRANANKLLEIIKFEQAKYIVALDICYLSIIKPIEKELKAMGIENVIILSASESMNLRGKIDYLHDVLNYNYLRNLRNSDNDVKKLKGYKVLLERLKEMEKQKGLLDAAIKTSPLHVYKYSDLVKTCNRSIYTSVLDPDAANYMGHTSGTSGARPKPIIATNRNGISTLEQLIDGGVSFKPGERVLQILPYFAPFGAYDNHLLNIASGSITLSVPEFEMGEFGYLLKKYQPNVIVATPAWLSSLPDCEYIKDMDLSFVTRIIYGGDSMSAADEERLNTFLFAHGSNAVVEKGHGMSEFLGCGTYAKDSYNMKNSIGIPLPRTIYSLVDPKVEDKLVPLKFYTDQETLSGELVVSSDAVTPGKVNGNIIVPRYTMEGDSSGKEYIRTRDLVHADRNGIFYHEARKDRSFTRVDGFKIKPYEIEKEILKNNKVINAAVVEYFDDRRRGIMPMCHIVLDENIITEKQILETVEEIVNKNIIGNPTMSSRQIPAKFKVRRSMPLTKNSKVDYNSLKMEELDGNEINVDVNETNLTVDSIEIYFNGVNTKVKKLNK